jgi:endoglucanase
VNARAALSAALLCCCAAMGTATAEPSADRLAVLRRGVNITNWFRYPPSLAPEALRAYLDDPALKALKRAGFTFVRLPVQPEVLTAPGVSVALAEQIGRLQRQDLGVVVSLHPVDWRLETSAEDRAKLVAVWRSLSPVLRQFDPRFVFPEIVNEPVFSGDPDGWTKLQRQLLGEIRGNLPANTIVLSVNDWGSISGLLAMAAEPDPNVVYSFHLYEPAELTALAAYRPGLDTESLARLPFAADSLETGNEATCLAIANATHDTPTADLMRFYCAQHWDGAKVAARIDAAADWARGKHVALLAGEFGASQRLNAPARLAWLAAAREAFERRAIGWALWGYDDSMGFALHPPTRREPLDSGVLRALGLAQPMLHK